MGLTQQEYEINDRWRRLKRIYSSVAITEIREIVRRFERVKPGTPMLTMIDWAVRQYERNINQFGRDEEYEPRW